MSAREVQLSWRPYGNQQGGKWHVALGSDVFETRSWDQALGTAKAWARKFRRELTIVDQPADEQLTFEGTADDAIATLVHDEEWFPRCAAAIAELARDGKPFQAFDLIAAGVPEPYDHHAWGKAFKDAARLGVIHHVGYGPSLRPTARKSLLNIWRGTAPAHTRRRTA